MRHCDGGEAQLGSFGLEAGMVDLSNPQAYAWMKEVVRCGPALVSNPNPGFCPCLESHLRAEQPPA